MKVKRLAKICVAVLTIFALWGMNPVSASVQPVQPLPSGSIAYNESAQFPVTQKMEEMGVSITFYELTGQPEDYPYGSPGYSAQIMGKREYLANDDIIPLITLCGGRMHNASKRTCELSNFNTEEGDYFELRNSGISGDPDVNYFLVYIK
ncbi:MAG: hypothetical protein O4859_05585 [Trichodesmium sp. St18_bin1]|nr:hypothetical protein [Trichodesmium sp. St18_bin1]